MYYTYKRHRDVRNTLIITESNNLKINNFSRRNLKMREQMIK